MRNDAEELRNGARFSTPILHPEWIQDAVEGADRIFELAIAGKLPESIAGWMVTTACLRILRCVYGDNLSTVIALRRSVLEASLPLTEEEIEQAKSDMAEDRR